MVFDDMQAPYPEPRSYCWSKALLLQKQIAEASHLVSAPTTGVLPPVSPGGSFCDIDLFGGG